MPFGQQLDPDAQCGYAVSMQSPVLNREQAIERLTKCEEEVRAFFPGKFGDNGLPPEQLEFTEPLFHHTDAHPVVFADMAVFVMLVAVRHHQVLRQAGQQAGRKAVFGKTIALIGARRRLRFSPSPHRGDGRRVKRRYRTGRIGQELIG